MNTLLQAADIICRSTHLLDRGEHLPSRSRREPGAGRGKASWRILKVVRTDGKGGSAEAKARIADARRGIADVFPFNH